MNSKALSVSIRESVGSETSSATAAQLDHDQIRPIEVN